MSYHVQVCQQAKANQKKVPNWPSWKGNEWMASRLFKKIFHLGHENEEATNPGIYCAGCTIVVGLVEQLSQVYDGDTEKVCKMEPICFVFNKLP